jgi:hypothetical protein
MGLSEDNQAILEALRAQLDFIEKGGYSDPTGASWRPPAMFIDSPTCLNFAAAHKARPCDECLLMQFVPDERRRSLVPCHHITLTEAGETVDSAEEWADQDELEHLVAAWLRRTIAQLEEKLHNSPAEPPN